MWLASDARYIHRSAGATRSAPIVRAHSSRPWQSNRTHARSGWAPDGVCPRTAPGTARKVIGAANIYERNRMLKKVVIWGGIAFVVFFVAFRPGAAGDVVRTLGSVAVDILTGIGGFFERLVG